MKTAIIAALALVSAAWSAGAADPAPAWIELAADGSLSIRAVVARDAACPAVTADGATAPAQPRNTPDERFPIRVCEAHVSAMTATIAVAGAKLPSLPRAVDRIVILGDTGCRIAGRTVQDCNDPASWPLPAIAAKAAARKPDLVIHVGDYYYRESACPAGRAGCAGSPFGDNWPVWQAEFFDPLRPLLAAAPWVMVRGNHESCRRGGAGWGALLDPQPGPLACAERTAPYRLAIGGLSLLLFDSADADDFLAPPEKVAAYGAQFAALLSGGPSAVPPHSWLVTHRPIWALAGGELTGMTTNLTQQQAIRGTNQEGGLPEGLDFVLAGHLHDFAAYSFGPARPAQLIVGTGGDMLLDLAQTPIIGTAVDGLPIVKGFAIKRFGYFVMERAGDGWDGTFYAVDDAVLARCRFAGRDIDCR